MKRRPRGKVRSNRPRPANQPRPASPVIEVRPEPFGCGFDVVVRPPQQLPVDREWPTLEEAVGYAEKLSLDNGWPISRTASAT